MGIAAIDEWAVGASTTLFARVHSGDGSGAATGLTDENRHSEGKYITAADVSTITLKVYDLDGGTPTVALGTVTITSAAIVTAVTSGFQSDGAGRDAVRGPYNFKFNCPSTHVTSAMDGHRIRKVCSITLTTGTVLAPFGWEGVAKSYAP